VIIRNAKQSDVMQISEIILEDWQIAYRGIIDSDYLDSLKIEDRYNLEINRYQKYIVAECVGQVVGCAWLENINDENADCEVIALYVRYKSRGNGIGKALLQYAMEQFKSNGNINMIIWCLKDNAEARKFYEKMGGKELTYGTHRWGNKDYDMVAYRYVL